MAFLEVLSFIAALMLVGVYFSQAKPTRRRYAFLAICSLGLLLITVGFAGTFFTGKNPFVFLGRRVSLLTFGILTFGTLLHERTFTRTQLRKYFYPAVCWWFVVWVFAEVVFSVSAIRYNTVLLFWDSGFTAYQLPPTGTTISLSFVLGAVMLFGTAIGIGSAAAARSRFSPRVYSLFLPILLMLLGLTVMQHYALMELGFWSDRGFSINWRLLGLPHLMWVQVRSKLPGSEERFVVQQVVDAVSRHGWWSFQLLIYAYMYMSLNSKLVKEYPRVKHLPKLALGLAFASLVRIFPEYESIRTMLPRLMKFLYYGIVTTEVLMTPALLVLSWGAMKALPIGKGAEMEEQDPD